VPLTSAAVIAPVAVLLPLIVRLARLPVPEIVLQIVLGINIGPRCSTGRTSTRVGPSAVAAGIGVPASAVRYGVTGVRHLWLAWLQESAGRCDHRSIAGPLA
jgi:Kef-type K+ transport system membrane component KefB